jgi:hypothetical protein
MLDWLSDKFLWIVKSFPRLVAFEGESYLLFRTIVLISLISLTIYIVVIRFSNSKS